MIPSAYGGNKMKWPEDFIDQIVQGNNLDVLRSMPAESVHMCVTSPPYWGLCDYGTPPQVWGGETDCEHEWGREERGKRKKLAT